MAYHLRLRQVHAPYYHKHTSMQHIIIYHQHYDYARVMSLILVEFDRRRINYVIIEANTDKAADADDNAM